MHPVKICLLSPSLLRAPPIFGGAIETFTFELGLGLARLNNDVIIITRNENNEKLEYESNLSILTLKIPENPYFRGFIYNIKIIQKLLKLKSIDIINTQGTATFPIGYLISKLFEIPIVHTEHVYFPWILSPFITLKKKIKFPFELLIGKFTMKRANKIIVANKFLKKSIQVANPGLKPKFEIIPQGIDPGIFNLEVDSTYIRKKFAISDKHKIILYVGRISPEKNVAFLIKAFAELKREWDNLKLLLVGPTTSQFPSKFFVQKSSKYYLELKNWIQEKGLHDSIIFIGPIPYHKMPLFYAGCNLIIQPSPLETFGRSIFEAAAMGKPFICSQIGGDIPEYLPKSSGIFIKEMTSSKLQSAIKMILKNEPQFKNSGLNAMKIIQKQYNFIEIAKYHLKIYRNLRKN